MIYLQIGFTQEANISLIWEEEEEVFFSGNLHRVKCEFTTNTDQRVKLIIEPEAPLKLLSPSSYKIETIQGETSSSSIKLYLPQTSDNSKDSLTCNFTVRSMENEAVLGKEKLCLEIKERIVIRLEPLRSQIPVKATDSLARVPIRAKNMGKRTYEVEVALQNKPLGLKVRNDKMKFMLVPKRDTLINFELTPEKSWNKVHSTYMKYALTLTKDGEEVADCKLSAFPMGHSKKFFHPNHTINENHEFGLGLQSRGASQKIYDFNSKGKRPYLNGILNYQLQSLYYSDQKELELTSSNLNYFSNKRSYTLGHVSYNDEVSLSGRGLIFQMERDSQFFHLGYINGSSDLLEPSLAFNTQTGNSLVGGFRNTGPNSRILEGNAAIRLRETSNSVLFWLNHSFVKKRNQVNLRLGLSGNHDKIHSSNNSINPGIALNVDYAKEAKSWNYQSNNHFSSLNYAGNLSGLLYTSNKFEYHGWRPVVFKVSARMQKSQGIVQKNDQKFTRLGNILKYQFQMETTQLGFWRVIVTPYQVFDRRNFADLSTPEAFYTSKSSRLKINVSRNKRSFALSWDVDVGTFEFGREGVLAGKTRSYRLGFKLTTRGLGFSSSYNEGSSLLSNALKNAQTGGKDGNFLTGVRWGKWFFKRKVKFNLSNQLSFNKLRQQWTNSSALRIKSILPKGIDLNTELMFFKTGIFNDLTWNVKLVKKIGNYRSPLGAKKLKITLYADANNNGQPDGDEPTLPGIFVQVDGIPFVTNAGGWILYKSVPIGEYPVTMMDPTGKLAGSHQMIKIEEDADVFIPLYKTIGLSGKVKEIKQRFKSSKFDLIGIPIIAKNIQEETFTTYTQPDGSFAFNLPANEYTIYIDAAAFGKNFEFPDNFQKVVLAEEDRTDLSLSVKVKSRKMKIQKF